VARRGGRAGGPSAFVLRLSGADALAIADEVFAPEDDSRPSDWPTYTAHPGHLAPDRSGALNLFEQQAGVVAAEAESVAGGAQPPSGCCRTAVEFTVDGCPDTRDVKGFHQLFILGNLERPLRQFCALAGIGVSSIY